MIIIKKNTMKNNLLLLVAVSILIFFGCQKQDDLNQNTTDKISIDSLLASHYTVKAWDTTTITCYATGDSLVYSWECDHGNFNGSGTQIKYAAGECCIGTNTITCAISNREGMVSAKIKINVTSYFNLEK